MTRTENLTSVPAFVLSPAPSLPTKTSNPSVLVLVGAFIGLATASGDEMVLEPGVLVPESAPESGDEIRGVTEL